MKLIIFDLDQTLVDFFPIHNETARSLFKKLFNVDANLADVDFSGKNLTQNFHDLAKLNSIPEEIFRGKSSQLLKSYNATFGKSLPRNATKHILPGASELLSALSRTDNLVVLYTGDSPAIVEHVFRTTELGKYFKFCMYGTEVANRADMVRLAIEKAKRLTGNKFKGKNVVIIGDSVRDIECGKIFNALTIAVATGFHSEEELAKAGPDYLLKDLRDYRKVMDLISSSRRS